MSSVANQATDRDTHHLHHEWTETEPVSEKVVTAIAEYEDRDVDALPPLEDAVNPTALDTLFESPGDDACAAGCVTFSYFGYTVLVQSEGLIIIKKR
ncbi:MAG: HalOD1 output domain-containing protein [Halopenitus sp.]